MTKEETRRLADLKGALEMEGTGALVGFERREAQKELNDLETREARRNAKMIPSVYLVGLVDLRGEAFGKRFNQYGLAWLYRKVYGGTIYLNIGGEKWYKMA